MRRQWPFCPGSGSTFCSAGRSGARRPSRRGALWRSGCSAYPVIFVSRARKVVIRLGHPFPDCQWASVRQTDARIDPKRRWVSRRCIARDQKIAHGLGNRVGAGGERLQFLRSAATIRNALHQLLACAVTARQRLRPIQSHPRRSRRPAGKWQKGRESATAS